MVPHLSGRAVTLRRFPEGVDDLDAAFFEKRCPKHRPKWVKTARVRAGPQRRQDRLLRLRRPADADLDGAAGGDRAASLALARRGRRRGRPCSPSTSTPGRRPTSSTAAGWRCACASCSATSASSASPRPRARRGCRSTSRSTPKITYEETQAVRPSDRPAARQADARRGRLEDGQKDRPQGQGLRRLVPEQPNAKRRSPSTRCAPASGRPSRPRSPGRRSKRRPRQATPSSSSSSRPATC